MQATPEIVNAVKQFILDEFLPGEPAENLTGQVPLISGGILDSIAYAQAGHVSRGAVRHRARGRTRSTRGISTRWTSIEQLLAIEADGRVQ